MSSRILVAGIGNIFLGDDAFGVEAVKRLCESKFIEDVSVIDFGIRAYDLAFALMNEWDLVILVDALPNGGKPGTIYVMEPELPEDVDQEALNPHTMNPMVVLQLVRALGGTPSHLLVVGCEPASVEANENGEIGLSSPVRAALDETVRVIEGLIARSGKQVTAA
jgi:hydrogenase maturation protease